MSLSCARTRGRLASPHWPLAAAISSGMAPILSTPAIGPGLDDLLGMIFSVWFTDIYIDDVLCPRDLKFTNLKGMFHFFWMLCENAIPLMISWDCSNAIIVPMSSIPECSMAPCMEYLPFTNMYPKTYPTVGKYSLHEAYGCICDTSEEKHSRKRTKKQNVQLSKLCCHLAQSFIPGIRLWPCIRSNLTNQFPHSEWNRLYFNQLGCSNAAMALSELTEKAANDYKWLHV